MLPRSPASSDFASPSARCRRPRPAGGLTTAAAVREAPPSLGGRLPLGCSRFCSRDDRSIRSRNIVYEIAEATTIVRTLRPDVEDALDQRHAAGVLGHRDATVARRLHSARPPGHAALANDRRVHRRGPHRPAEQGRRPHALGASPVRSRGRPAPPLATRGGGVSLSLQIASIGRLPSNEAGLRHGENRAVTGGLPRADARTRTGDPFITSEVLYQLSYVGVCRAFPDYRSRLRHFGPH